MVRKSIVPLFLVAAISVGAFAQPKKSSAVERGKYLVAIVGCNDCHSPKLMTPMGPVPDSSKFLSGHPANSPMPTVADSFLGMTPDKWIAATTGDFTAWRGPWGTSFTANLTPDKETGLGSWTEAMFVAAIRTGKHMGKGREILPPMPVPAFQKMTDADLKAIFSYLKTIPAVSNAVPDPIPPPGAKK